jgi:hypothetical protein
MDALDGNEFLVDTIQALGLGPDKVELPEDSGIRS